MLFIGQVVAPSFVGIKAEDASQLCTPNGSERTAVVGETVPFMPAPVQALDLLANPLKFSRISCRAKMPPIFHFDESEKQSFSGYD
jgi:hypothetical protein